MATQTFYSAYVGNLRSYIVINEKSQDIAGNRTLISYSVYADKRYSHNPYNLTSTTPVYVNIGGSVVYNKSVSYDLRTTTTQLIASGETYVAHNNDGTKALTVSMSVNFSSTGTAYGYGKTTATGSMNLTTIARASTFSLSSYSFDFGTNITMTINRSDSSFTHNVEYTQPNGTTTSVSTTATTSATLNIPISLATQIPNTTSYVSTITVKTKNSSGTVIGSNTTNATVVLNETYKPSISALNPTGPNATIGNNTTSIYNYLGGVDKVGTTITASGSNGSTISFTEYRLLNSSNAQVSAVTVNGTGNATFTAPTVPSSNAQFTLQARVIDSRGRYSDWKSAGIKIRSHYYKTPSISGVTVGRSTSNQNYMVGRVSWATTSVYSAGGTAGQINTASMVFKYRKKGVTTWTTLTTNTTLSTTNYALPFNSTVFAPSDTFEFIGEVTDKFGNKAQTAIVTVNGTFVHMDFGPKGVGIGKDHSDSNYDLEVGAGGAKIDGGLIVDENLKINGELTPKYVPPGANLNNYTSPGFYYNAANAEVGTMSNRPTGNAFSMLVMRHAGVVQILTEYMTSGAKTFIRNYYGSWGAWTTVVNENDVKTLMAGSPSNFDSNTFIQMVKTGLGNPVTGFNADNFLHGIVWCHGSGNTGTPSVDGLLFAYRINANQATQVYFGIDNRVYQRQRSWSTQTWGGWGTEISGNGSASSSGYTLFGDYQIAFGKITINSFFSAYTLTGSATFYRNFVEPPVITLTTYTGSGSSYHAGDGYVQTVTNSGFTAAFSHTGFKSGDSRVLNYIAVGKGR